MASITEERLKEMEEEMNRFEEEISSVRPPVMPAGRGGGRGGHNSKVIIGANTFHEVAAKLTHPDEGFHDPHQMAPFQGGPLPPPPPPPSMSDYMGPAPGMAGPMRPPPPPPLHSGGPPSHHPPPPQRHPAFVPPQIRHHRPPMNRPPMNRPPMNRVPPPFHEQHMGRGGGGPPMMRPPPPPRGLHPPMRPQGPFMGPSQGPPRPMNPAVIQKPPVVVEKPKIVYSAAPVRNVPKEEVKPKVVEPEVVTPVPPPVAVVAPPVQPTVPMETMQSKPLPPVSLNPDRCAYVVPGMSMETEAEAAKREKKEKKKKFTRTAAGTSWEDNTLGEWEQDDFRIFCGDIGNEVTEECLARAFSRYPSFLKSRVVRDKRTNKTRGYGFVSFKDPNDFVRAMREMNGKYVGNRPIKLRKSSWKDRQFEVVKKKDKEKKKLGFR